eukprot:gene9000-6318_t
MYIYPSYCVVGFQDEEEEYIKEEREKEIYFLLVGLMTFFFSFPKGLDHPHDHSLDLFCIVCDGYHRGKYNNTIKSERYMKGGKKKNAYLNCEPNGNRTIDLFTMTPHGLRTNYQQRTYLPTDMHPHRKKKKKSNAAGEEIKGRNDFSAQQTDVATESGSEKIRKTATLPSEVVRANNWVDQTPLLVSRLTRRCTRTHRINVLLFVAAPLSGMMAMALVAWRGVPNLLSERNIKTNAFFFLSVTLVKHFGVRNGSAWGGRASGISGHVMHIRRATCVHGGDLSSSRTQGKKFTSSSAWEDRHTVSASVACLERCCRTSAPRKTRTTTTRNKKEPAHDRGFPFHFIPLPSKVSLKGGEIKSIQKDTRRANHTTNSYYWHFALYASFANKPNSNSPGVLVDALEPSSSTLTTDDVIAELKILAQSMLEASKEARRRVLLEDEGKSNSTSALLGGSAGGGALLRGHEGGGAYQKHHAPLTSSGGDLLPPPHTHAAAGAADPSGRSAAPARWIAGAIRYAPPPAPAPAPAAAARYLFSPHADPAQNTAEGGGPRLDGEALSSSSSRSSMKVLPVMHQSPSPAEEARDDLDDDSQASYDLGDDDDELDLVLTCFKAADRRKFERMTASLWLPEPVSRNLDGSFAGRWDPDQDRLAGDTAESSPSGTGGDHQREASSLSDDPLLGNQSRPYKRRSNNNSIASSGASSAQVIKTYRVPLFPYGGGVTGQQLKNLTQQYEQCGRRSSARAGAPMLVRQRAFVDREYPEITASHHRWVPGKASSTGGSTSCSQKPSGRAAGAGSPTSIAGGSASAHRSPAGAGEAAPAKDFKPESLYDFVVEVERGVRFDPIKARRDRQQEFKRLVKEKRAPVTMGTFHLKVIMDPIKTGFEDERTFPIHRGSVVADRYQIAQLIAKSTFSRTVRCYDLEQPIYEDDGGEEEGETAAGPSSSTKPTRSRGEKGRVPVGYQEVCIKIIHNSKDFFDQSLDEIRLLRLLNQHKDPDEAHVIRLLDVFYYKEHCMLVTELLSDSLYEYSRYNREEEDGLYFNISRLRRISRQVMEALVYVHSLNLIHADLKPENILFVSHRRCIVKVIDFGSSSFLSDHLSSYIQSRNYRAPEVILGCDYDGRIDIWSFGAILMELVLGEVLFTSSTVPEMLARIVVECGHPMPRRMLWEGRYTQNFFTKFGAVYELCSSTKREGTSGGTTPRDHEEDPEDSYYIYTPRPSAVPAPPPATRPKELEEHKFIYYHPDGSFVQLRKKLVAAGVMDRDFTDFVEKCLTLDHKTRPTSAELLQHPFIRNTKV